MSGGVQLFLRLPDLNQLCCITLSLQEEEEELRSKQIKTCRELVLLYSDVLAFPALDSFTEITAVMAVPFFKTGILQAFGGQHSLKVGSPQCVFPGILQACLSYSLITRLTPRWNKAGLYLISGKDFLTNGGKLNAVSMELSTSEGQLCMSIEASRVRLPPNTLEDFGFPPLVLRRFCSDPDSVLHPSSTGGAIWCHVLPSMKKGQIITLSRKLPKDGPFRTYRDLQNHWNHLYGYRLPELADEEVVYCSVFFRLVGDRPFTYPLSCIRLQPVQRCPRVELQGVLGSFLCDIKARLQSVCGFPSQLTTKPCYPTVSLYTAATAQVLGNEQVNLASSCSIRPVLAQLPPPPPMQLSHWSQPLDRAPISQQDGVQEIQGNGCGFRSTPAQSQQCPEDEHWPSSSSHSHDVLPSSVSFRYQPAPSISSSSSFLSVFQPASSLISSSDSSSSSFLPPSSPTPPSALPPPKLVPIFKNKCPSRHVNVALLRAQKQREQLIGGEEKRGRVTLPAFIKKQLPTSSSSSVSFLSAAPPLIPPPPITPHFKPRLKPQNRTSPCPADHPKLKRFPSLSHVSKSKPRFVIGPNPEIQSKIKSSNKADKKMSSESSTASKSKPRVIFSLNPEIQSKVKSSNNTDKTVSLESKTATVSSEKMQEETTKKRSDATKKPPGQLTSAEPSKSSTTEVMFESVPKKSKSAVRVLDVEKMARNNQLSKLSSATLLAWLKGRGVSVGAKHRKEELMLKVMGCLAEA
ncbi:uncharacterized protein LOC121527441 [Cheilinus undulatus]|uniref:uncharacterized protein LOC121527441 n=1 Tax=Cheilinus undulatus TaxID=241271 RepID=UPI001BD273C3|nr:uncharacterized protein LOC121527441 [Cheilinus undulatus]